MALPEALSRAPGGYLIRLGHPDGRASGTLMCSSQLPRKAMSSTGGSELEQVVRTIKSVLGLRIYFKELQQPRLVLGPTPVFTDASVVVDGTNCRRVSREMKWVCLNYAIVRQAVGDGGVTIVKCATEDNAADGLTKPLTGKAFIRSQRMLQGLPPPTGGEPAAADDEDTTAL